VIDNVLACLVHQHVFRIDHHLNGNANVDQAFSEIKILVVAHKRGEYLTNCLNMEVCLLHPLSTLLADRVPEELV
jgi:hypothetical protein